VFYYVYLGLGYTIESDWLQLLLHLVWAMMLILCHYGTS